VVVGMEWEFQVLMGEVEEGAQEALEINYGDVERTNVQCSVSAPNRTMKVELSIEDESQCSSN